MKTKQQKTELLISLKNGDMVAFDTVYNAYCRKLYEFVIGYLKRTDDAEEIVQEVFIKIWEARSRINVYSSFDAYLFTIAYNTTMSLLRKRVSENKSKEYLRALQLVEPFDSEFDSMHFEELSEKIELIIAQLTPRQKEIFRLSRIEGLSHRDIAIKLQISESTVNNHLVNTIKFIKAHLGEGLAAGTLFYHLFIS